MFSLKKRENGFEYIEIKNNSSEAKIALQGAHIFDYKRSNEEPILWLSETSLMQKGENIRGGIPICWPSFGLNNPELPAHGFARNEMWNLVSIVEPDSETSIIIMDLKDSKKSREKWKYKFHLRAKFTIEKSLSIELTTHNKDARTFTFTQALHTYFKVSHIHNIVLKGLHAKPYLDAVTNKKHKQEGNLFFDKEVDYVYQEIDSDVFLQDEKREIKIQHEGSFSCVVWNPWIEKTKRMSAMKDEAYKEFVCIETANAFDDYRTLKSGESHTLKVVIS